MTTINFEDVKLNDSERQPCEVWSFILAYASAKARPLIWMLLTLPQNN